MSPAKPVAPAAQAPSDPDRRQTFATLDGLRGVAALAVVLYHFASDLIAVHGYLAVDIFFAMSGFVIASAYERRLETGLGLRRFLGIRLRRLAPLWVLGSVVGLGLATLIPAPPAERTLWMFGLALLLVPHQSTLVGAFPMNTSLWSLHVELVINLAYAALVRWLTTPRLLAVSAASFVALAAIAFHLGAVSYGTSPLDLVSGYLRALVSFPVGIVAWRLRARLPRLEFGAPALLAAVALLLTGFGLASRGVLGVTYDLLFIGLGVPVILCLAVANEPTPRLRPLFVRMGTASYALYVLHQPIVHAARRFAADHGGVPIYLVMEVVLVPVLIALAWAADRCFDAPLRGWLASGATRWWRPGSIRASTRAA